MFVQRPHHVALLNPQQRRRHQRRRGAHSERLSGQTAFTEEVARREHGDDRLPARRDRTDSFTPPSLDVEHAVGRAALREDNGGPRVAHDAA